MLADSDGRRLNYPYVNMFYLGLLPIIIIIIIIIIIVTFI